MPALFGELAAIWTPYAKDDPIHPICPGFYSHMAIRGPGRSSKAVRCPFLPQAVGDFWVDVWERAGSFGRRRPLTGSWISGHCRQNHIHLFHGSELPCVPYIPGKDVFLDQARVRGLPCRGLAVLSIRDRAVRVNLNKLPWRRKSPQFGCSRLIAEIEFRQWTPDGKLRQPSY
ncbi:hypothetical protein HNR29_001495 [Rhizobium leguminosarum]|nr:hypothetical protein [Rhizobium leguminosarum]